MMECFQLPVVGGLSSPPAAYLPITPPHLTNTELNYLDESYLYPLNALQFLKIHKENIMV